MGGRDRLGDIVDQLKTAGIRVSLFVEPDPETLKVSAQLGADIVELHTGTYCEHVLAANEPETRLELEKLAAAATQAHRYGLEVHAGHGLTYNTVSPIAEMTEIVELNIGHFLIGEAIFTGLDKAVLKMRAKIAKARATAVGD